MSRTEEISSDVKAVSAAADETRNSAEEALEYARTEIEMAYEHGWDGVAQSINLAGEALEKIVAELSGTEGTCENATTTLDSISEQMSHNEVAAQLALTVTELEATHNSLQGTVELVEEAVQGAEQAEHEALAGRLHNLREEVEKLLERLLQSRTDAEAEHEQAEKMGQQEVKGGSKRERNDDGGMSGADSEGEQKAS